MGATTISDLQDWVGVKMPPFKTWAGNQIIMIEGVTATQIHFVYKVKRMGEAQYIPASQNITRFLLSHKGIKK